MTDDEALETLFAMANVQDGYAKKATGPGLKLIYKANAKAQREVAAVIADLRAKRDRWETDAKFWENRENEAVKRAEKAEAERDTLAAELAAAQQREAVAYRDGWRFAYRQCLATGSVPDPDYKGGATLTPTDPGDGWTWNERLGWIGPDGKPAGRGK